MSVAKSAGRGLSWNDEDLFPLTQAAPKVCEDPAVGVNMSRREIGRRLESQMVARHLCPSNART